MKKRPDGRYLKVITLDGKRINFYSREDTEKKAERDIQRQMVEYIQKKNSGITFTELVDKWEDQHYKKIGYNTRCKYERAAKVATDYFDNIPAKDITILDVQKYINGMATKNFARDTVSCRLSVLSQIFKFGVLNGYVETNVCDNVNIPRNLPKTSYAMPTEDDINVALSSIDKHFGLYAYMAITTGMRREELLALTFDDIDFKEKIIHITKAVVFEGNNPVISKPKTKASMRSIIIPEQLVKVLKSKNTGGYIFKNTTNENMPMTLQMFRRAYARYQKESGIKVTSHSLRHGYATILYDANIDIKQAQKQLGHSKINTTMDIYTHISESRQEANRNQLNTYLESLEKPKKQ